MHFTVHHESDNEPQVAGHREPVEGATSAERYVARIETIKNNGHPFPRLRHEALWLLHNCVAHPLLALGPSKKAVEFHELTSQWLADKHQIHTAKLRVFRLISDDMPRVQNQWTWAFHNVVGHIAIGLAPNKLTFAFHDWSAKLMNVPGWV